MRIQAGLMRPDGQPTDLDAFHINQRDEGIDLHGVSGALLATTNMQMQTFVTQPDEAVEGFDGYNGDLTGDVAATLGVNCGMSTGRNGIMAFAANQRDEVRDLHDVAGALQASPGMKQQTFVAEDGIAFTGSILQSSFLESNTVGTQMANQSKCYNTLLLPRNPAVFGQQTYGSYAPGFSTLAATGGTLGYGGESLVVDDADASAQPRFDRSCEGFAAGIVTKGNGDCFLSEDLHTALSTGGGQAGQGYPCVLTAAFSAGAGASAGGIGYGEELSPTLKGSAGGNCMPSVLCLNDQGSSVMNCSENVSGTLRAQEHGHQPLVYENHGVDSRYTGPHKVAPTMSARYGTGGNNVPLVEQDAGTICIAGNTVDRQPQNGGNGLGCQDDLAYTLTATDRHAVYSRQRVDDFRHNDVASTQSARQYKDATDLICQQAEACAHLIRRLTPLECERLQGFPDGWTDIPGASDSARYKALGNSVAIPCVEFIMSRIAAALL
ncbi:DNA cytosine methyltransferase [Faecalicatena sp. BF-R-105]|nr:DNA cytosine methyltransferase [Faecalicatena sp. BF-R-105]